jgi:putative SOS response-associated peptidase YedK
MAGRGPRYALAASAREVQAFLGYRDEVDFPPRYNIAPPQPIAVVHRLAGERRFTLMRWGFVPAWVKDPSAISLLVSARAESLTERPAFAAAYRYRRCLMPATALAGLWETWSGADGSEIDTACLITIAADPAIAAISARTPVIMAPADFEEWLASSDSVEALLRAPRSDRLSVRPVSARVDSVRNDGPDLLAPLEA